MKFWQHTKPMLFGILLGQLLAAPLNYMAFGWWGVVGGIIVPWLLVMMITSWVMKEYQ